MEQITNEHEQEAHLQDTIADTLLTADEMAFLAANFTLCSQSS